MPPPALPEAIPAWLPALGALATLRVVLVPPHIVPLHPTAKVHGEIFVGRAEIEEFAVLEEHDAAQVAADLIRFGCLLGVIRLFPGSITLFGDRGDLRPLLRVPQLLLQIGNLPLLLIEGARMSSYDI